MVAAVNNLTPHHQPYHYKTSCIQPYQCTTTLTRRHHPKFPLHTPVPRLHLHSRVSAKCKDKNAAKCQEWANSYGGVCPTGWRHEHMLKKCPVACGVCKVKHDNKVKPTTWTPTTTRKPAWPPGVTPHGKIRLGFLITSSEKSDYLALGRTWDHLVNSLRADTQKKLSNALSPNANFPFDMTAIIADVIEVDSSVAAAWLGETGKRSSKGLLETSKYAKQHLSRDFDIAVLVFSKEELELTKPSAGYTLRDSACGGRLQFGNAIHIWGYLRKYSTMEVLWHRLLAHEIGHQMGANEGPGDSGNQCYDVMSFSPASIPETQLWKSCSIKSITELQQKGKLRCLGL